LPAGLADWEVDVVATGPVGPYSPIVRAGEWLIVSGQLGMRDGSVVDGGVGPQTTQALANMQGLLEGEGASLGDVVKTMVFLTDVGDFAAMNEAYVAAFAGHRPARSTVGIAGLPAAGCVVEIEAWALRKAD
jgi:2-iminobutanoate/2-iminopropanoate deaminase